MDPAHMLQSMRWNGDLKLLKKKKKGGGLISKGSEAGWVAGWLAESKRGRWWAKLRWARTLLGSPSSLNHGDSRLRAADLGSQ